MPLTALNRFALFTFIPLILAQGLLAYSSTAQSQNPAQNILQPNIREVLSSQQVPAPNGKASEAARQKYFSALTESLYQSDLDRPFNVTENSELVEHVICQQPNCLPAQTNRSSAGALPGVVRIRFGNEIQHERHFVSLPAGATYIHWDPPATSATREENAISFYDVVISSEKEYFRYRIDSLESQGLPIRDRGVYAQRRDQSSAIKDINPTSPAETIRFHGAHKSTRRSLLVSHLAPGQYKVRVTPYYTDANSAARKATVSVQAGLTNESSFGFYESTVGGVSFSSKALQNCVYAAVNNVLSTPVSNLTNLSCSGQGVYSLEGIQAFTNLTYLNVSSNPLLSITPLSSLPSLESLYLGATSVNDLSALSQLNNLRFLHIYQTNVSDLLPLANLPLLTYLYAQNTPVNYIPDLSATSLSYLNLSNAPVNDISGLRYVANLSKAYLYGTQLGNLKPLLDNANLYHKLDTVDLRSTSNVLCAQLDDLQLSLTANNPSTSTLLRPLSCSDIAIPYAMQSTTNPSVGGIFTLSWQVQGLPTTSYRFEVQEEAGLRATEHYNSGTAQTFSFISQGYKPIGSYVYRTRTCVVGINQETCGGWSTAIEQVILANPDRPAVDALSDIADLNLKNCVAQHIVNVTRSGDLTYLQCQNQGVTSLQGLDNFPGIGTLHLNNNPLTNLTAIDQLSALNRLQLYGCGLTNNELPSFSGVNSSKNYLDLNLSGNQLTSVSALSNLDSVAYLYLDTNQVQDITPLNQLNLATLSAQNNQIAVIPDLKNATPSYLSLEGNSINDISGLATQTSIANVSDKISNLRLSNNPLSAANLNVLSGLSTLKYLLLENTGINDLSFAAGLSQLQGLYLGNNPLSQFSALSNKPNLVNLHVNGTGLPNLAALDMICPSTTSCALVTLNALNTQISTIGPINHINGLNTLRVSDGSLSGKTSLDQLLAFTQLTELELSNNRVKEINRIIELANLRSLRTIKLNGEVTARCSQLDALEQIPSVYLSRPPSCSFDIPEDFHVARDTSTGDYYISWERPPSAWGDVKYQLVMRAIGGAESSVVYDADEETSPVIQTLEPTQMHEFRLRACRQTEDVMPLSALPCSGDWSPWLSISNGLAPVQNLSPSWLNANNGQFTLSWQYPSTYFTAHKPDRFNVYNLSQPDTTIATVTVGATNQTWTSTTLNDSYPSHIFLVSACAGNPEICGPSRNITVTRPVNLNNMPAPLNVSIQMGAESTPQKTLTLSWQSVSDSDVDYYQVQEVHSGDVLLAYPEQDQAAAAIGGMMSLKMRRPGGSYSFNIRACHRDRVNNDSCGQTSVATTANVATTALGFSAPTGLCWSDTSSPDLLPRMSLQWRYQGTGTPSYFKGVHQESCAGCQTRSHDFIVDAIGGSATTYNASLDEAQQPLIRGLWNIYACSNTDYCQSIATIARNHAVVTDGPECAAPVLTPSPATGPGSLAPGSWFNPDYNGQGWYFYWANRLQLDDSHPEYGNTYDLVAIWGTYRLFDGHWRPVWLYSKLKADTGGASYRGELVYPRSGGSNNHEHVGHIELVFDPGSRTNATVRVRSTKEGGLSTLDLVHPSDPNNNGYFVVELGNISDSLLSNPIYQSRNEADHLSGLWSSCDNGDCMGSQAILLNLISGSFDGNSILFYDSTGQPIWANTSNCDSTTNPPSCAPAQPGYGNYVLNQSQIYTVAEGFNPLQTTPEDFVVSTNRLRPASNSSIQRRFASSSPAQSSGSLNISSLSFTFPGSTRFASLNLNSAITKRANLHRIRYRVNGNSTNSECTLDQESCALDFTWYSDGIYPGLEPRYIRVGDTDNTLAGNERPLFSETQAFDTALCGQNFVAPPLGSEADPRYQVEHYECAIRASGQYRFYLFSHRELDGGSIQSVPLAASRILQVRSTGDTAASSLPLGSALLPPAPINQGAGLSASAINNSAKVGTSSGSFNVDASGAATYQIAIATVPGTAGVSPEISLTYNSQSGAGIAGQGWSIGGLSMISRCGNNYELDGFLREVQLDQEDRFCLDGQRLVKTSSSGIYGGNGVEYHTEIESFARIRSYGDLSGGPRYFKVEGKDGSTSYYGDWCYSGSPDAAACPVSNTSADSMVRFNTSTPAYAWGLDCMRDSARNYIAYRWLPQPVDGIEMLIDEVAYTGHHGDASAHEPFAKIKFNYSNIATAPDPSAVQRSVRYLRGMKLISTRYLNQVDSYSANTMVRRYKLAYAANNPIAPELRMMQSMTECTLSGGTELCYDPVVFDWYSGENFITATNQECGGAGSAHCFDWDAGGVRDKEIASTALDFDGNGTQDSLFLINDHSCPNSPPPGVTPDPDDVIELDVLSYTPDPASALHRQVYSNVGQLPCHVVYFSSGIDTPYEPHWIVSDYDADGFQDIIYIDRDNSLKVLRAINMSGQPRFSNASVIGSLVNDLPTNISFDYRSIRVFRQADFNGDGRSDLFYSYGGHTFYLSLHTGDLAQPYSAPVRVFGLGLDPMSTSTATLSEFGISLTQPSVGSNDIYYSPLASFANNARLFDVNGDGAVDLLVNISAMLCTPSASDDCLNGDDVCPPNDEDCQVQTLPDPQTRASENRQRLSVWYALIANPNGYTDPTNPALNAPYFDVSQTRPFFWQFCDSAFPDCAAITASNSAMGPVTGLRFFETIDINNDSLADLIYRSGADNDHQWRAVLNTGTGFAYNNQIQLDLLEGTDSNGKALANRIQYLDYDGNGYTDILFTGYAEGDCGGSDYFGSNCDVWRVLLNNGGQFANAAITAAVAGNLDDTNTPDSSDFRDVNGDGLIDHLYFDRHINNTGLPSLQHVYVALGRMRTTTAQTTGLTPAQAAFQINAFHTGIAAAAGQVTRVDYALMTDASVYQRANNASNTQFGDSVIYDLIPSGYLVREVSSEYAYHRFNGNDFSVTSAPVKARYFYTGAKIQAGGRGFLGFANMLTYDPQNHQLNISQYRQDFPFIGQSYRSTSWYIPTPASLPWNSTTSVMPCVGAQCTMTLPNIVTDSSCVDVAIDGVDTSAYVLLSNAEMHWQSYNTAPGVRFTYPQEQRQCSFTPSNDAAGQIVMPAVLVNSVRTTNQYNANTHGNLLSARVTTYYADLNSQAFSEIYTQNTYADRVTSSLWYLGRLTHSSVRHRRWNESGQQLPDTTRTSDFDYDPNSGILTHEWVEKNTDWEVSTRYVLDSYGNVETTITEYLEDYGDGAIRKNRQSRVVYDSLGRFVDAQYDADDVKVSDVISRNVYGNVTAVADVQGQISTTAYDPMGRPYYRRSASGAFGVMTYHPGSGSGSGAGAVCPSHTQYYVHTRSPYQLNSVNQAVVPQQFTCYDAMGREIRTRTENFEANQWIYVDSLYDDSGRSLATSRPLSSPGSLAQLNQWGLSEFDDLGRVWRLRNPDGSMQRTEFHGLTTIQFNENNQRREETLNPAGETILMMDAYGGEIRSEYDAVGNLQALDGPMPGVSDRSTMSYNTRGHKTSMQDPDKGFWQYKYNTLGELICQIDANGDAMRQEYDHFGRQVKRSDYRADNFNAGSCSGLLEAEANHASWTYITNPAQDGYGQLLQRQQLGFDLDAPGSISVHREAYRYDALGRVARTETTIDGATYIRRSTYDEVGRTFQDFDAHLNENSPLGRRYYYNAQGYLQAVREAANDDGLAPATNCAGVDYYQCIVSRDVWGNVVGEFNNAGDFTYRRYDVLNGRAEYQETTDINGQRRHLAAYAFDDLGNLTARTQVWPNTGQSALEGVEESFVYDQMNRLVTHREFAGVLGNPGSNFDPSQGYVFTSDQPVKSYYRYDGQYSGSDNPDAVAPGPGNMSYKGGLTMYYGNHPECVSSHAGPHAVCGSRPAGSSGPMENTYHYDLNGSNLSGAGRSIAYTVFSKPYQIQSPQGSTYFWYDSERNRFKREDVGERYEYYIGNVEVLKENGRTIYRRNVGSTILRFDPLVDLDVQHSQRSQVITDHLGSTVAVHTPDPSAPWQYQSFEPFGNKLHQSAPSQMIGLITHWTDRGFTGHEGVDKAGIIHMNGRIYDPAMGRFLQADPFIQEPDNTQSLNRYSYVINNPLSYTDPSGYFFSRFVSQIWRPLANIVGCAAGTAAAQPYLCGATVAATGLVDGQSVLSSLRDGLIAGVQAVVFNQIGIAYNGVAGKEGIAAFLHGAVGAASSALQGGDPVSGFLSSSVTKGISLATKDYLESLNNIFLEAVIVGTVGGSISTLTGGKFANGAVTGAIGYVYNAKSKISAPQSNPIYNSYDSRIPIAGFNTKEEAAALGLTLAAEKNPNEEFGGGIYEKNGKFYLTEPVGIGRGETFSADIGVPKGATLVGTYHPHPLRGNSVGSYFSPEDIANAESLTAKFRSTVVSYVGDLKDRSIRVFEPSVSEVKTLKYGSGSVPNTSKGRLICEKNCF